MGSYLQAICVDKIEDIAAKASELKEGNLCVFSNNASQTTSHAKATALLSKVKSQWSLDSLLSGIYTADSLDEALALCGSLSSHESVITPDGMWLNTSWLQLSREENPAAGIFQREQELKQLTQQISKQEAIQEVLENEVQEIQEQFKQLESQRDQLQKTANQCHAQAAEVQAREKMKHEQLADFKQRAERIIKEQEDCVNQLQQAQDELTNARSAWQEAMTSLEQQAEKREALVSERDQSREKLLASREKVNLAKDHASELQIRLQTTQSQQASLKQTAVHMRSQLSTLAKRKTTLENELQSAASVDELEKTLAVALEHRLAIEAQLNSARTTMETMEQELRTLESNRQALEREMSKFRDVLETLRLECQSLKVKSEGLSEQIKEIGLQLEDILQELPEGAVADAWHTQLEQINQRINRLGPINLVAIEEYATCSERKDYLDKQHTDLQDGLNTLENAITKIDKETRARFKETFDKVNDRFQELFPTIFGGGR